MRAAMAPFMSLTHVRSLRGLAVDGGLGRPQEVAHRDAGDLDRVLHGEEEAGSRPLVDAHREDVLAIERHRATRDGVLGVPGHAVGQGGLAGAVRTHERVRLPRLHGQVDPAQDLLGAVLGLDRDGESLISSVLIVGQFSLVPSVVWSVVLAFALVGAAYAVEASLRLDRCGHLVPQVAERDLADDVGEEATDDEPLGLVLRDAPRLQVEQLEVVESSRRGGVAGPTISPVSISRLGTESARAPSRMRLRFSS